MHSGGHAVSRFGATILDAEGLRLTAEEKALFAEYDPFGFILFARNIDTPDQVRALCSEMRAAVGRAVVTEAPDGTRWVGVSAVHVADDVRRQGLARTLCAGLLAWGREHGATRGYVQVVADNTAARALYESMGFVVHHRSRYVRAAHLLETQSS